jgi:membrane protein
MNADNAAQMAAALTYRTIFGLVSFFVLGLVIFKAFGGLEAIGGELQGQIYRYMGLDFKLKATPQTTTPPPVPHLIIAPESAPSEELLSYQYFEEQAQQQDEDTARAVDPVLADLNRRVSEVSFASIGVVGVALLIWAALALAVTVEQCFNQVFDCEVADPGPCAWRSTGRRSPSDRC